MKKTIFLAIFMIATASVLHAQNAGSRNSCASKKCSSLADAKKNKVCSNSEKNTCKSTGRFVNRNDNNGKCVSPGCGRGNNAGRNK